MVNSDKRKLTIAGWLKNNDVISYNIPLKLQKFLFFYECARKVKGLSYDFNNLRGYKNGPVFIRVWKDYTRERQKFDTLADEQYKKYSSKFIDSTIIQKIDFFIKTCTEAELSDITCTMNIWQSKKDNIKSGEYQALLNDDFNSDDKKLVSNIMSTYSEETIENSEVISIRDKAFILRKEDATKLSPEQMDTLQELANLSDLENPVYVSMDSETKGRLLVD